MANDRPGPLTHAGGVVYRTRASGPQFLLITARREPGEWVLPKGHVEPGESPEQAAVREVAEEAGVRAKVVATLGDVTLLVGGERQVIRFFLMSAVDDGAEREGRRLAWLGHQEALSRLAYPESRNLIDRASRVLTGTPA
jgi:8-oxo-dGTP pyrophosphatase MutT (NUDIX family)